MKKRLGFEPLRDDNKSEEIRIKSIRRGPEGVVITVESVATTPTRKKLWK
jgi:hypothetical protein